jgi:hypothetical protein
MDAMGMDSVARSGRDASRHVARGADRRVRRRYVFHDRRSGFDRRHDPDRGLWDRILHRFHTSDHLLEIILVLLVALNLADLVFTRVALGAGAIETNPVMAALFDESFVIAAALKILVSLMIVFIVLVFRRYRKMMALAVFCTVLYAGVFAYHLATTPLL